jgi:filamentous hemagglutinin family protein
VAAVVLGSAGGAWALPQGMQVRGGQLQLSNPDANSALIRQGSRRAAADFRSFNIGAGQRVRILQPDANSAFLGRITGGRITEIHGRLDANGRVMLVNPAGLIVGPTGVINTAAFAATTLQVDPARFLEAGVLKLGGSADPGATITNYGQITVADGGFAALIAPHVSNHGLITAKLGTVQLASGTAATLDISGDGLLSVTLDPQVAGSITNTGAVQAQYVRLGGGDAAGLVAATVHLGGVVEARSAASLLGGAAITVETSGAITVTGRLDANGAKGGTVKLLGEQITIQSGALVEASGPAGGGEILIGGNYLGQGPEPNAKQVVIEQGAAIRADATDAGDGGRVIVWSDERTEFHGAISAEGGPEGGDGGFVETSSKKTLIVTGTVSTAAPKGKAGQWLLDPEDVEIGEEEETSSSGEDSEAEEEEEEEETSTTASEDSESSFISSSSIEQARADGTDVTVVSSGDVSGAKSEEASEGKGSLTVISNAEDPAAAVAQPVVEQPAAPVKVAESQPASTAPVVKQPAPQPVVAQPAPQPVKVAESQQASDGQASPAVISTAEGLAAAVDQPVAQLDAQPAELVKVAESQPASDGQASPAVISTAEGLAAAVDQPVAQLDAQPAELVKVAESQPASDGQASPAVISSAEGLAAAVDQPVAQPEAQPEAQPAELVQGAESEASSDGLAAVPAATSTAELYRLYLNGEDLNLSAQQEQLIGRNVVIASCEGSCTTDRAGNIFIDSLKGLASLEVLAPADITLSREISVSGALSFAGALNLAGANIAITANELVLAGPVQVAEPVKAAGGPALTISSASADRAIQLGGSGQASVNLDAPAPVLQLGSSTLNKLNQAGLAELKIGGTEHTGGINLDASASLKASNAVSLESQQVSVAGAITAGDGNRGGQVTISGDQLSVQGTARIDASGAAGGGEILIGGSWQNENPAVRQAETTTIEAGAEVIASGTARGSGGTIVAWSDITNPNSVTTVAGSLKAEGGALGGDGGRIETSGYDLKVDGIEVSTQAPQGQTGQWLLDPYNITIGSSGATVSGDYTAAANSSTILASTIETALTNNNVTISTGPRYSAGTEAGTITVESTISSGSERTLELKASDQIVINADVTRSGSGGLTLRAGSGLVSGSGTLKLSGGTNLALAHGTTLATNIDIGSNGATIGFADLEVEYLVVGGGGSGGGRTGGGGGAGEYIHKADQQLTGTSYAVTVGAGGGQTSASSVHGNRGGSSSFAGITADGGGAGAGASSTNSGKDGGSGGGGTRSTSSSARSGGASVTTGGGLGNAGGTSNEDFNGAGGGGAGSPGGNNSGGAGGDGVENDITGESLFYAAGGGGGVFAQGGANSATPGDGGSGVGGDGGKEGTRDATAGKDNTGSGGGGGGGDAQGGAAGGSGVVIVRYTGSTTAEGGNITENTTGNFTVHTFTASGDFEIQDNFSATISGNITGSDTLTVQASRGAITLAGDNTHSGDTTVAGGTLEVTGTLGHDASAQTITGSYAGAIANSGTLKINTSASQTLAGAITGTGQFEQAGSGTTILTSAGNTYTGATTISGGVLQIGNASAAGSLGGTGTVTNNAVLRFAGGGEVTVAKTISGTGAIEQAGSGKTILTANNTYSGPTTISDGILQIGNGGTSGQIGTGNITNDTSLIINRSNAVTIGSVISGSGSLTQAGTGTLTLSGTNTYSGKTSILAGTLSIGSDAALGAAPGTVTADQLVINGGTLLANNTFSLSANRGITLGSNGGSISVDSTRNFTVLGVIAGATDFTKIGAGTLTLSSANTYTGNTRIAAGELSVANVSALGSGSAVRIDNVAGARLTLNSTDLSIGSLAGGGTTGGEINLGSNTLTIGGNNTDSGFAGKITGTGSLIKIGSGTLTLSSPNSDYSGTTTMSGGLISVSGLGTTTGALGNSNLVFDGGGLRYTGATGSISRDITINDGKQGVINVFNPNSTLTLTGNITATDTEVDGKVAEFVKSGGGTLILDADNSTTFEANTKVDAGTLTLRASAGLGVSTNTLTMSGGSSLLLGHGVNIANNITLQGSATIGLTIQPIDVEYLIVGGGGGGGGSWNGGGGGAGGFLDGSLVLSSTDPYSIVVGGGGAGHDPAGVTIGTNGGNSSFAGLTALGGGRGATEVGPYNATAGGSGGGGSHGTQGPLQTGGGGADGQGNRGGDAVHGTLVGPGGGGAGDAAANVTAGGGPTAGGIGKESSITGTALYYAGGGGGSSRVAGQGAAGGQGGGGAGGGAGNGSDGAANTGGGGGGGGGANNSVGGDGGSGIVVVRYAGETFATGGTIDTITVDGVTYTVHSFTDTSATSTFALDYSNLSATISGNITGAGDLTTDAGDGTLTLAGNNTFGDTNIAAGTLKVTGGASDNPLGTGAITNAGELLIDRSDALTISTAISGTGALVQTGSGTTTLTGTNTYSGQTRIEDGVLSIGSGGTTGTLGTGRLINDATLKVNRSDDLTFAQVLDGSGNLVVDGGGKLTLTGNNVYTGTTQVKAGTLQLGAGGNSGTAGRAEIILDNDVTTANSGGGNLIIDRAGSFTLDQVVSGEGSLTKKGTGTLNLVANNTYSGGTTVEAGTLALASDGTSTTPLGSGALTLEDASSLLLSSGTSIGNAITLNGLATIAMGIQVDYLVVGGGGGGGAWVGGGGGGGGVLTGTQVIAGGSYGLTVGAGGSGAVNTNMNAGAIRASSSSGGSSSIFGVTALGGGHGGSWTADPAASGASGGGQGHRQPAAQGTEGQGFAGGRAWPRQFANGYPTGGGGGAGGVGGNWTATKSGDGGIGIQIDWADAAGLGAGGTGWFGGGGGGGVHGFGSGANAQAGAGGQGGGGAGAQGGGSDGRTHADRYGQNGIANTGGGGGGSGNAGNQRSEGGDGGSGLVVVRYAGSTPAASGGTTVRTVTIDGIDYTFHEFKTTGNDSFSVDSMSAALTGTISGSGSLDINAAGGELTLGNSANTYTGSTRVSAGTLSVSAIADGGAHSSIGSSSNAAANLQLAGGALKYTGSTASSDRNITIAGSGATTIDVVHQATTLTLGGTSTAGSGGILKAGAGTLTLSGDHGYSGSTLVAGGTLNIEGAINGTNLVNVYGNSTLNIATAGSLTTGSGGTFAIGSGQGSHGTVNVSGALDIGSGRGAVYIGGRLHNTGTAGIGTLNINHGGVVNIGAGGAPTVPGGSSGRVWLNPWATGAVNTTTTGATINVNSGGTLETARVLSEGYRGQAEINFDGGTLKALSGGDLIHPDGDGSLLVNINGGGLTVDTNGFNTRIAKPMAGTGGLTLDGTGGGTLRLNKANTYSGGTTVDNGTLLLQYAAGGVGTIRGALTVNAGGVVDYSTHHTFGWQPNATSGDIRSVTSLTINGGRVGGNNFANHFWGRANDPSGFELTMDGGELILGGTFNEFFNPTFNLSGDAVIRRANGNSSANLHIHDGSNLTINAAAEANALISAPIRQRGNASNFNFTGPGTLTLSGANGLWTGTSTIDGGRVILRNDTAFAGRGTAKTINIHSGGVLEADFTSPNHHMRITQLNLGADGKEGGMLAGNGQGHPSYGEFYLDGNVTVRGTSASEISADVRIGRGATRIIDVADVTGGTGNDLVISGNIGHFNGISWGYFISRVLACMSITGGNDIGGAVVRDGILRLEGAMPTTPSGRVA